MLERKWYEFTQRLDVASDANPDLTINDIAFQSRAELLAHRGPNDHYRILFFLHDPEQRIQDRDVFIGKYTHADSRQILDNLEAKIFFPTFKKHS